MIMPVICLKDYMTLEIATLKVKVTQYEEMDIWSE